MFMPFRKENTLVKAVNQTAIDLPVSSNLSTFWNLGFLLSATLMVQIITGIILSSHYTANVELALASINSHIGQDVNAGWLLRNLHANGAGALFICMYLHMGRGMYLGSYANKKAWMVGLSLMVLSMATALLGYVLVWGQMSYWAATVITNLLTAISYVGTTLAQWTWGDYSVSNSTLNRLFSFHFVSPFIIAALTITHLIYIHETGSSNPTGLNSFSLKVPFHQYFTYKDAVALVIYFILLGSLAFFMPATLGDAENYNPADALVTPAHIKPEFYFLWAYAILRSVPNKLGGVVAMFSAIILLGVLPFINNVKPGCSFCPVNQILLWVFVVNLFLLSYIGACPVEAPYENMGRVFSLVYFAFFIVDPFIKKKIHLDLMYK
nr:cytochrome b [Armandia sp. GK-2021]